MLYLSGIPIVYSLWVLGTWAPVIFMELGVPSLSAGAIYASLLGLASLPGLWFSGVISDRLRKRGKSWRAALTLNFSMLAAFMFAVGFAIETVSHELVLALLVFLAGFSLWGVWAPFYALTAEIIHPSMHGTAYGLLNSINFIGSVIAPWLTGFIRDVTGSFTWGAYLAALLVLTGLLLLQLVKPAFSLTREEKTY
jgi:sugar phosphate permease